MSTSVEPKVPVRVLPPLDCVTCPVPFGGTGESYEIAVFDESCQMQAVYQAPGGRLVVEVDLGPQVKLVQAPPLRDGMPVDSAPADPGSIPCGPPSSQAALR